jgi:hypothetical protein
MDRRRLSVFANFIGSSDGVGCNNPVNVSIKSTYYRDFISIKNYRIHFKVVKFSYREFRVKNARCVNYKAKSTE